MNSKKEFAIYGSGMHANVLTDLIVVNQDILQAYFNETIDTNSVNGYPNLIYDAQSFMNAKLLIGIGNPQVRQKASKIINHAFGILIHPDASVAASAQIGSGTVILAGAVVQANAKIGKHVIINANVTIDHDAIIGDFVNIYPNTYVGGAAEIEELSIIGAGVVISRLVKVLANTDVSPLTFLK